MNLIAELQEEELILKDTTEGTKGSFKDVLSQLQRKKKENETDEM